MLLQIVTLCVVSEKKWNTKEDKAKSMMHACIVRTAIEKKAHLGTKQRRKVKKSSP